MKNFVTQPYHVHLTDGTTAEVCCAPRMVQKFNNRIRAYWPTGPKSFNVCCHKGRAATITRRQNRELNDYLARREGKLNA